MVHVLYLGDVKDGEKVEADNVKPSSSFRVKTKSGRYAHILAWTEEEAKEWASKN